MTTLTFDAVPTLFAPARHRPSFAAVRAALPDLPARPVAVADVVSVAVRGALALVPFSALAFIFVAV